MPNYDVEMTLASSAQSVTMDASSGGGAAIDDNAGAGDTDKTWSADKLVSQFNQKASRLGPAFSGYIILGSGNAQTIGVDSVATGRDVNASGDWSHAEGGKTTASGMYAHAEGYGTKATGDWSHAEGGSDVSIMPNDGNVASGKASHAEGQKTTASGVAAHAEGYSNTASGSYSHAEGNGNTSSGQYSHTEGTSNVASGSHSHAEGMKTLASRRGNHVFGEFNVEDPGGLAVTAKGTYIEIVGNGTANDARSNARTLDWSGNQWLAGSIEPVGGIILKSSTTSSTKRFMITVDDSGVLSATEIT